MGEPYGLPDLRHMVAEERTHFQATPQATESYFVQRNLAPLPTHHETIMVEELMLPSGGFARFGHQDDLLISNIGSSTCASTNVGIALYGVEMERGWHFGNERGSSRWPRQETLTLLEIRSRLDSKFKEANQKGPLWDEVSRIMSEEHGYQRSGKKCREKFENLYKYYKKTKEGKAGRQDGKHYRFYCQLEALYGDTRNQSLPQNIDPYQAPNNTNNKDNQENLESYQDQKLSESLSFSNTSAEFETSSSENNEDDLSAIAFRMNQSVEKQKMINHESQSFGKVRKSWKVNLKDFVDSQMRKLMKTQEAWMERMVKTIEDREQERMLRQEEWRKQELARFDREHEYWASERNWIEARDAALMEALKISAGKGLEFASFAKQTIAKESSNESISNARWTATEISSLIHLTTSLGPRFQDCGSINEGFWVEIAAKMASLGYERSALTCKDKWENVYFNMAKDCHMKQKEDLRTSGYLQQLETHHGQLETTKQRLESINVAFDYSGGTQVHDNCLLNGG
ncbi:Myb_DNA-bind_4 domain-containing protein [Cephalotus follicularis]|uniref:Myb_DNA-bind_4 domain-containing protein n=1 Tax=Cephalotus follicularis TaxID=3775 RepID=A0A1Q3CCV8_CEPFO|nr:Myb_DNA-bind_4 domain-containing protein [Cephalotus follicularis]